VQVHDGGHYCGGQRSWHRSKGLRESACPVHHPKQEKNRDEAKWKAEQGKQRKEQAIANTTGIRFLKAIGDAVPVRLMKRDLLFVLIQTFPLLNEWQLQTLARQHGIRKDRETDILENLSAAFLRRADEGNSLACLSRLVVSLLQGEATERMQSRRCPTYKPWPPGGELLSG
jgi:hypothetical protein